MASVITRLEKMFLRVILSTIKYITNYQYVTKQNHEQSQWLCISLK
jgi:hypothetical protein